MTGTSPGKGFAPWGKTLAAFVLPWSQPFKVEKQKYSTHRQRFAACEIRAHATCATLVL
jgi:hypothetical protein